MKRRTLLFSCVAVIFFASCSKSDSTSTSTPVIPPSDPINSDTIPAFAKGTLLEGKTYTMTVDVTVKAGDTLYAQPGANIIVKNNNQFNILGNLDIIGTEAAPVTFNSMENTPGTWGGFQCDSAQSVTIKWAKIFNTGGPDPAGDPRKTIYVKSPINVDIEDCWITNGQDDIIRIQGGATITILRNTISSSGSTDGEAINLKTGVTGDVAYNVVYSQAGTGIKLETSALMPFPQTIVKVYNNTLVSDGWRRGAAEPGRGISVGVNAVGYIYNNIMVNDYQGLEIFQDADTIKTVYGNNLFYASADAYTDNTVDPNISISIRDNFYPNDGVGKPQSSDLISTGIGNLDPLFASYDKVIATPNGAANNNNFHLNAGSPATGKGNSTYNNDIGAYTSDGKGNKH